MSLHDWRTGRILWLSTADSGVVSGLLTTHRESFLADDHLTNAIHLICHSRLASLCCCRRFFIPPITHSIFHSLSPPPPRISHPSSLNLVLIRDSSIFNICSCNHPICSMSLRRNEKTFQRLQFRAYSPACTRVQPAEFLSFKLSEEPVYLVKSEGWSKSKERAWATLVVPTPVARAEVDIYCSLIGEMCARRPPATSQRRRCG